MTRKPKQKCRLRITADRQQWIVNQVLTNQKTGEEYLTPRTYHLTLEYAIHSANELYLRELVGAEGFSPAEGLDALFSLVEGLIEHE
jgi:hypothetical protein